MIERLKYVNLLSTFPRNQFIITGGAWLAIMNIRQNDDIDIIISEQFRSSYKEFLFDLEEKIGSNIKTHIDKSRKHGDKIMAIAKVKTFENLIKHHTVAIDGFYFIKFVLYMKYKQPRKRAKDRNDLRGVAEFFKRKKNLLPEYKGLF